MERKFSFLTRGGLGKRESLMGGRGGEKDEREHMWIWKPVKEKPFKEQEMKNRVRKRKENYS